MGLIAWLRGRGTAKLVDSSSEIGEGGCIYDKVTMVLS